MIPTNCKNCGAPLYRSQCDYCGTRYDFQESVTKYKPTSSVTTVTRYIEGKGFIIEHAYSEAIGVNNQISLLQK